MTRTLKQQSTKNASEGFNSSGFLEADLAVAIAVPLLDAEAFSRSVGKGNGFNVGMDALTENHEQE